MTVLVYTYINTENVISDIITKRPSRIIFFGEREWEFTGVTRELIEAVYEYNVDLTIVHGCFKSHYHIEHYASIGFPIEKVVFWGTYFFNYVYMHLHNRIDACPETYKPHDFKHHFISLNNRSHIHRCAFIEEMSKQNLLDSGIVSWVAYLNENNDYPYQYFNKQQRLLDDGFAQSLDSYTLPIEYHESLFELVTESTPHIQFITEKTVRNLLLKKPFVILGAKGINRTLINLGFKLYDEVIDYSFDDEDDLLVRTEKYVNNIRRILSYDPKELYQLLLPKLIHNYYVAMNIIMDQSLIPESYVNFAHEPGVLSAFQSAYMKKVKYFSIWQPADNDELYDTSNTEIVIFDQSVEFAYEWFNGTPGLLNELIQLYSEYNVPIKLLTSTRKYNKERLTVDTNIIKSIEILDSPGFWILKTFSESVAYGNLALNMGHQHDILNNRTTLDSNIEYLYISLNNIAHPHRCMMMDILYKYDLLNLGKVSWRDMLRCYENQRTDVPDSVRNGNYQYRYWTPERLLIDTDGLSSNVQQHVLPNIYKHCFMQLIAESTVDDFFLTEKTATALLYNKIFLVVGSRNFHKNLVDMGFKLYTDLFDYSFDELEDTEARIEGIIKNIDRYRNHSTIELEQLRKDNENIIQHNRQIALDYVFNKVPNDFRLVFPLLTGNQMDTRLNNLYHALGHKKDVF